MPQTAMLLRSAMERIVDNIFVVDDFLLSYSKEIFEPRESKVEAVSLEDTF
jgi:hypothetical protein